MAAGKKRRIIPPTRLVHKVIQSIEEYQHSWISCREIWCGKNRPVGLCAIASKLLLEEWGEESAFFVQGEFIYEGTKSLHCWIESETHIIDVTASQFYATKRVMFSKNSKRHAAIKRSSSFEGWNQGTSPFGKNQTTGKTHIHHVRKIFRKIK